MVEDKSRRYRYPQSMRKKEWEYERFKADLYNISLTPEEYKAKIKDWCNRNNF